MYTGALVDTATLDSVLSAARSAKKSVTKKAEAPAPLAPRSPLAPLSANKISETTTTSTPKKVAFSPALPPKSPRVNALIQKFESQSAKKEPSPPTPNADLKKLEEDIARIVACRDSQEFTRSQTPVAVEVAEKPAEVKEEVAQLVTDKAVENSGRFSWPHYATRESIEAYEEELYLPEEEEDEDETSEGTAMNNADIDALCSAFEGKLEL